MLPTILKVFKRQTASQIHVFFIKQPLSMNTVVSLRQLVVSSNTIKGLIVSLIKMFTLIG